jgi:hypothetical protein
VTQSLVIEATMSANQTRPTVRSTETLLRVLRPQGEDPKRASAAGHISALLLMAHAQLLHAGYAFGRRVARRCQVAGGERRPLALVLADCGCSGAAAPSRVDMVRIHLN